LHSLLYFFHFTGITLLPRAKKKDALSQWILTLEQDYAERILPVDTETARVSQ